MDHQIPLKMVDITGSMCSSVQMWSAGNEFICLLVVEQRRKGKTKLMSSTKQTLSNIIIPPASGKIADRLQIPAEC